MRSLPSSGLGLALALVITAALPALPAAPPSPATSKPDAGPWTHTELRRLPAAEARQGVATDGTHLYAIDNRAIGKYRLDTGTRVGGWQGDQAGPIIHLNAGIIWEGRLYCAHSNYPARPTTSSVEMWDTATMQHVGSHSFGIYAGSLTWIDRKDGSWYACFARYAADEGGPAGTQIIRFDDQWRRQEGWIFPPSLIKQFAKHSSSGGAFGPGGVLFVSGHDAPELYALRFPDSGSVLEWRATVPISAAGQAFSWNPAQPGMLCSILRSTREIVLSRVTRQP